MNDPIDVSPKEALEPQYLGDAVYASFDGYQLWLTTSDGGNQRIAIEPSVYFALRRYARRIFGPEA